MKLHTTLLASVATVTCLSVAGQVRAQDMTATQDVAVPPLSYSGETVMPSPDGLDMREAVESALQSHPAVFQSSYLVEQKRAEERIVRSDGRPVVEYSLQPGYNPQSDRDAILQFNVTARVPVYDFGQNRARRSSAALRTDQYRHMGKATAENVALELVNEYLKYALWRDAVEAADQQLEQLQAIRARIELRVRAGLADISDLRRTDVSISRATLQRTQALNLQEMAEERIRALSSQQQKPVVTLEEAGLILKSRLAAPVGDVAQVPLIAASRSEWEASRRDVDAARANRFPTISLGVSNSSYIMDDRGPGGGSSFDNRTQFGVFLTGRVAFGGGARHQVAAANAASMAAQSQYQTQLMMYDMGLAELDRRRREAGARDVGSGAIIETLEGARDLYWQEYILSKRRLTEVFDIEREIYQSRVDQFQARADELSAIAEYLGVQGLLVDTLRTSNRADSQ